MKKIILVLLPAVMLTNITRTSFAQVKANAKSAKNLYFELGVITEVGAIAFVEFWILYLVLGEFISEWTSIETNIVSQVLAFLEFM